MSRRVALLSFLSVLLVLGIGVVLLLPTASQEQTKRGEKKPAPRIFVEVAPVRRGTLDRRIAFTGDIAAQAAVQVYSKVSGVVEELGVEEGEEVQKGQFLGMIEHQEIAAQVRQAEARVALYKARYAQIQAGARPEELSQAQDRLRKSEANLHNAQSAYERTQQLFTKNLLSPQALEDAKLKYDSALAEYNIAKDNLTLLLKGARAEDRQAALAQVQEAEAELDLAKTRLSNARIVAPIRGVVSKRHIDQGDFVTLSSPLFTLVAMDQVKILGSVSERDLGLLQLGQKAEIRVDAYPGEIFLGVLTRISPTVDRETRKATIELAVPNADHRLKPGMFARVELIVQTFSDGLIIPKIALLPGEQDATVFIYHEGKVQSRRVRIGYQTDHLAMILENLQEGEQVVVKGQDRLKDGMMVSVAGVAKEGS